MSDQLISKLRSAIDRADQVYHTTGNLDRLPKLSDTEYDALKANLRKLCPEDPRLTRVGAPYSVEDLRNKVKHKVPTGSLDNVDGGISGFTKWHQGVCQKLATDTADVMCSLKIDGCTAVAEYEDGQLKSVVTRGNGEYGEDITANAVQWRNLPTHLPIDASVIVRGEVVLYREDFDAINQELGVAAEEASNPRNVGNGIIGRTDGRFNEKMRFIAFNLVDANGNKFELNMSERFETLKAFGFKVVDHMFVSGSSEFVCESVEKYFNKVEETRESLPHDIDGVVVSLDSNEYQLRLTSSVKDAMRPKHSRAIKFVSFKSQTKVIGCDITVGHTGALIPTAILERVRVGGVFVQHALLNNWDEINRLDVAIGDTVEVELAGDIIPKVVRVVTQDPNRQPIEEPLEWNGHKTTRMNRGKPGAVTYLVDAHDTIEVRRSKIKRYIGNSKKGVGILGVGDGVLEALTSGDSPLVTTPADLYRLKRDQLVDLTIGTSASGSPIRFGESRTDSLLAEIEKAKSLPLPKFLGSLGIDLLGRRRVEQFVTDYKLTSLDEWLDESQTSKISGDTIREAIQKGLRECRQLIDDLVAVGVQVGEEVLPDLTDEPSNGDGDGLLAGKSFCFTGTRELVEDVVAAGGVIKSGVSRNLDFLVQKDPTSQSNKTQKADEYGVEVIGVDYLRKVLVGEATL